MTCFFLVSLWCHFLSFFIPTGSFEFSYENYWCFFFNSCCFCAFPPNTILYFFLFLLKQRSSNPHPLAHLALLLLRPHLPGSSTFCLLIPILRGSFLSQANLVVAGICLTSSAFGVSPRLFLFTRMPSPLALLTLFNTQLWNFSFSRKHFLGDLFWFISYSMSFLHLHILCSLESQLLLVYVLTELLVFHLRVPFHLVFVNSPRKGSCLLHFCISLWHLS